jgi:hypothetical protein
MKYDAGQKRLTEEQRLPQLLKRLTMVMPPRAYQRRTSQAVCWTRLPVLIRFAYTNVTSGLFQISVKLPHAPHKIQVMVGII